MTAEFPRLQDPLAQLQGNQPYRILVKIVFSGPTWRVRDGSRLVRRYLSHVYWPVSSAIQFPETAIELPETGMCGVLILKSSGHGELAIVAGIDNSRISPIWFDVLSNLATETADQVEASYYGGRPKRKKKRDKEKATAVLLAVGKVARVTSVEDFLGRLYRIHVEIK